MSLIVQIRDLREGPVTLTIDHAPEFFQLEDETYSFKDKVTGEVVFTMVQRSVLARGWLETLAWTHCVRCLCDMQVHLRGNVELMYTNDPKLLEEQVDIDPIEEIFIPFENEIIEPRDDLRELIMIELPFLPLCKAECKGLCSQCGANLNLGVCACSQKRGLPSGEIGWKDTLRKIRLDDDGT